MKTVTSSWLYYSDVSYNVNTGQLFISNWTHNILYPFIFFPSNSAVAWMTNWTDHKWQNWKRVFLLCYCHEIYRVKGVGLKTFHYSWKITIIVNIWNSGQFLEKNWYFGNNFLIKVQISEFFFTHVADMIVNILPVAN